MIARALDWVIEQGKALLAKMGIGKKEKGGAQPIGEVIDFEADGESHQLWIETTGDDATVMIASERKSVANFLKSKEVKKRSDKDPKVAGLVVKAKEELKKVDKDADGIVKAMKQIDKEQTASASGKSSPKHAEKVAAEERDLAKTLMQLLKAMHVTEPVGGLHGELCAKAAESAEKRESHHVPAKTLGRAIGEFLENAAAALGRGAWKDNDNAKKMVAAMEKQSAKAIGAATEPADKLSAILISFDTHKGDFGVHSSDFGEVMLEIEEEGGKDRVLMCKNKTARKINGVTSYIAVNPQMPGWREFLADVQRQLHDGKGLGSDTGRGKKTAVQLILAQAAAELDAEDKATDLHLKEIRKRINKLLTSAPTEGFESGRATVARAMEMNLDGTPAGQKKALKELRENFEASWALFEKKI
jgi:hypothetical protein